VATGKSPYTILKEYEQTIIDSLIKSLENNNKIAGGMLAQSIEAKTKIFGQSISLQVYMNDYWKYVDSGRKKGSKQPPQDAMLKHIALRGEWHAKRVNDISNFYTNSKGLKVKRKNPLPKDKARKSLAFLIGRSIKRKGIKPTNFVEEGISGIERQLEADLLEAVGRQIEVQLTVK
jgi:uncharacterized short protein YbdD (DUF466 family)